MNSMLLRAEWRAVRRASLRLTQNSLALVGLVAVGVVGFVATHPEYARAVVGRMIPAAPAAQAPSAVAQAAPFTAEIAVPGTEASRMLGLNDTAADAAAGHDGVEKHTVALRAGGVREKQEAVGYLARKYRVNSDAISILVDAAYATGRELNLDPLLLLSVMAVESGFNPFAESNAGASGLMQVMSKVHADKLADFGGANIALNPVVNLRVGAAVLKDCIRRGGSIADGLRLYVGAGTGDDAGYGSRVLQEKDRLAQVVRGLRPKIEPISVTPASTVVKTRTKEPDIDHSFDSADPSDPKVDAAAGRVAAL